MAFKFKEAESSVEPVVLFYIWGDYLGGRLHIICDPLLRICPVKLVTLLEKDFLFAVFEGLGLGQKDSLL